ncbi:hypothetical protein BKA64DRAFT_765865 [Cadophora sp. MPI-SDFR-AT-0126]|nr:hypothetical protein BKA64DRAFT_765865 [Leotiomycetes sp. MPI-SDFR-AT-0126]
MNTGVIIGTGRQSDAVINLLSSTNSYHLLVFTRNTQSKQAVKLQALPNVELVANKAETGFDTAAFLAAASQSDFVFVNTDGFALGEQAEIYWGIRLFELASKANVKHLIYSGLDYIGKESSFDPKLYVGHYEGKARVQEFIHAQAKSPMAWTIIRSGPYVENLAQLMAPVIDVDGKYLFQLPLGNGAIPFIDLESFAGYVLRALQDMDQSAGLDFGVAIEHITGQEIADAFTTKTGKRAQYVDFPINDWHAKTWTRLPKGPDTKIGFQTVKDDNALLMTFRENFTNWWNLYKASSGNTGLIRRDYQYLDKILPNRVKTVGEWIEKAKYTGERESSVPNLE